MSEKLTYKDSGVDIHAGYKTVRLIKDHVKKTYTDGVVSDIGGFGGMFAIDKDAYEEPVLVSGTDGVGTKLMIAFKTDKHDTIGEDAVAMCVNDVICQGAKPLFFLDYIATGKLLPEKTADIVKGVASGCIKAGAALIGGETAEMPGLYSEGEYDIAGFCVGIVDKKKIIDGSKIVEGDILIGIPSSGIHSNGYSLVRKVFFDRNNYDVDAYIDELGCTLGESLMVPTKIYPKLILDLISKFEIKGMSNITGGGFYENIPRMFPEGITADIYTESINVLPIFELIQKEGNIDTDEMYSTFNMGIGMVLAVDKDKATDIIAYLKSVGEKPVMMGKTVKREGGLKICR
ncbi:phosphoribosylformylglycinamidine cyclo-ligase [Sedimentibacter hydroxybenzoicus DSM 7310]|uniref:Phosphoribosylformylglycinamidine cyclo-ligase n=1 Tax=Sedimentibacter hydroxybenzoicus DSM 7310 TaxID=1123245 RepID=A0A974BKD1_SEDHY|nr:phosphoribosylformylglycinamidine cyclo-ligase [Sedimentibacter hydroxybenzoicus]NYB74910.1 phosphoribosylformylglycinamidine cyclo-ligase [Sedimentibacter hydroxybenzoicus DSM 7310]